jgi:hypothetical protein
MNRHLTATVLVFLACCGGGKTTVCDFPDNVIYETHYTELTGGTCGPIETSVMAVGQSGDPAVTCSNEDWVVERGGCQRWRSWTCTNGSSTAISTVSIDAADSGNWIGQYSARLSGATTCSSVYDVVLVKR